MKWDKIFTREVGEVIYVWVPRGRCNFMRTIFNFMCTVSVKFLHKWSWIFILYSTVIYRLWISERVSITPFDRRLPLSPSSDRRRGGAAKTAIDYSNPTTVCQSYQLLTLIFILIRNQLSLILGDFGSYSRPNLMTTDANLLYYTIYFAHGVLKRSKIKDQRLNLSPNAFHCPSSRGASPG